jgi:integrase
MIKATVPSIAAFAGFVQLQDFRPPTRKEYVRYVRRLGDHYQCDPATLCEDQIRAYYLELRQVRQFGGSAMKVAKCALRCFYREHLKLGLAWTVFEDPRIAPPKTLPLVLSREEVATLLKAVQLPRYRTALGLIYHPGLRVGEAVGIELRDLREPHTDHPRLHVRCGKGGKDRFAPLSPAMVQELRGWWQTHRNPTFLFPGPTTAWRERGRPADAAARQDFGGEQGENFRLEGGMQPHPLPTGQDRRQLVATRQGQANLIDGGDVQIGLALEGVAQGG